MFSLAYMMVVYTDTYENSNDGYFKDISLLFLMRNARAFYFASEV